MVTNYFLNLVAGNVYSTKTDPAVPETYYLGLSSTEPNLDGENASEPETAGTGYSRVALSDMSEPEDGVVTNQSMIAFPTSTQAWGTMTHYVIFDSMTSGNLLIYGTLAIGRTIEADTTLSIAPVELDLSVKNPS